MWDFIECLLKVSVYNINLNSFVQVDEVPLKLIVLMTFCYLMLKFVKHVVNFHTSGTK